MKVFALTTVLLVAAIIAFVVGLVSGHWLPIVISIACVTSAGLLLEAFTRLTSSPFGDSGTGS